MRSEGVRSVGSEGVGGSVGVLGVKVCGIVGSV